MRKMGKMGRMGSSGFGKPTNARMADPNCVVRNDSSPVIAVNKWARNQPARDTLRNSPRRARHGRCYYAVTDRFCPLATTGSSSDERGRSAHKPTSPKGIDMPQPVQQDDVIETTSIEESALHASSAITSINRRGNPAAAGWCQAVPRERRRHRPASLRDLRSPRRIRWRRPG